MIAEIGLAALCLAAALAVVQLVAGNAARPVAVAQALMALIALAAVPRWILLLAAAFAVPGALVAISGRPSVAMLMRVGASLGLTCYAILLAQAPLRAGPPMAIGIVGLILFPWLIAIALPRGFSLGPRRRAWARRSMMAKTGMIVALAGAALAAVGAVSGTAFASRTLTEARPGAMVPVGPWLIQFATVNPLAGPDWTAIEAALRATRGRGVSELHPQSRTMIEPRRQVSDPAVANFWDGRLSSTVEPGNDGGWRLRLEWRPLVLLPWLGGALLALGGLIVLAGLGLRSRRRREREG